MIKMEQNIINLNKTLYSNNNNILLEIVEDLNKLMDYSKDDLIIKILGESINKINIIINENKKYFDLIRNDISSLSNQINKRFDELNINQINSHNDDEYVGQFMNELKEGKGIYLYNNGTKYEGDFKNGKKDGKGIKYYTDGNRYEGDYKNGKKEGKGITYYNDGSRYEGDYKIGKKEGKGIYYYTNGDRYEGDFKNNKI